MATEHVEPLHDDVIATLPSEVVERLTEAYINHAHVQCRRTVTVNARVLPRSYVPPLSSSQGVASLTALAAHAVLLHVNGAAEHVADIYWRYNVTSPPSSKGALLMEIDGDSAYVAPSFDEWWSYMYDGGLIQSLCMPLRFALVNVATQTRREIDIETFDPDAVREALKCVGEFSFATREHVIRISRVALNSLSILNSRKKRIRPHFPGSNSKSADSLLLPPSSKRRCVM